MSGREENAYLAGGEQDRKGSSPMPAAKRMEHVPFSGIRKIFEEVGRRERLGQKIIHLEIGRPDFDTPAHIKERAMRALAEGQVHYTSNYGLLELRQAVSRKLSQDNGLSYKPEDEIIITLGANEAVFLAMTALLNPGDEVLIPDPCWPHYHFCARMIGAVPVPVPLRFENDFNPDPVDFKAKISDRTKMMVVNTPNNPTGAVFSRQALEDLSALAQERNLFVLSDEIYEKMVYDQARHHSIAALPGMWKRTLTINGFSKIFAMTGWRLGYVAGPENLIQALVRVHQYVTICAVNFAQWGGVEALTGPQDSVENMVREFDRRRIMVCERLGEMPGIELARPCGAFYLFPRIKGFNKTPEELCWYLLEEAKIAVVPGTSLGEYGEGHIRISYANSYEALEEAMDRMATALKRLAW